MGLQDELSSVCLLNFGLSAVNVYFNCFFCRSFRRILMKLGTINRADFDYLLKLR